MPQDTSGVVRTCRALARQKRVPVLCPVRLPRARWTVRYRSLEHARTRYLIDLRVGDAGSGAHHVLVGGRRRPFDLRSRDGQWPARVPPSGEFCCSRPGDLGLIGAREQTAGIWEPVRMTVVRSVWLRQMPGLMLAAVAHPDGGIHGGHVALVWNQGGHGYVFSIHARHHERPTLHDQRVALAATRAVTEPR
jgi:hypothetical protein